MRFVSTGERGGRRAAAGRTESDSPRSSVLARSHPFAPIAAAVAAVAGLGQRVGAEGQVRLGFEQLADDLRGRAGIEVVCDLVALVAHPLVGLELRRPLHHRQTYTDA